MKSIIRDVFCKRGQAAAKLPCKDNQSQADVGFVSGSSWGT